jgi:hypothetical protein
VPGREGFRVETAAAMLAAYLAVFEEIARFFDRHLAR